MRISVRELDHLLIRLEWKCEWCRAHGLPASYAATRRTRHMLMRVMRIERIMGRYREERETSFVPCRLWMRYQLAWRAAVLQAVRAKDAIKKERGERSSF